jgi:UDP-GlcNAc:undecaprenyl-phosphate GlcNAc-1-phosphate transferase
MLVAAAAPFLVAFVVALVAVPSVREFAIRVGALDHPNERRLNREPMPNLGGIAIYSGFLAALLVVWLLRPDVVGPVRDQVLAIAMGGLMMVITGFIDDQYGLSTGTRLSIQTVAAGLLIINGIRIQFITDIFGSGQYLFFDSPWIWVPVTLVWIVGITNALNFIDGMDGLAAGVATIAALAGLAVALQFPERAAAVMILAALAGSALGFLRHNFNPARIIMGDSGAYLLGYVLAGTSILAALKVTAAVTLLVPVAILALPILDVTQVTLRRLARGASPAQPGRDHIHHRLLAGGLSQRRAVLILWGVSLALAVIGMLLAETPVPIVAGTVVTAIGLISLAAFLRVHEVRAGRA